MKTYLRKAILTCTIKNKCCHLVSSCSEDQFLNNVYFNWSIYREMTIIYIHWNLGNQNTCFKPSTKGLVMEVATKLRSTYVIEALFPTMVWNESFKCVLNKQKRYKKVRKKWISVAMVDFKSKSLQYHNNLFSNITNTHKMDFIKDKRDSGLRMRMLISEATTREKEHAKNTV